MNDQKYAIKDGLKVFKLLFLYMSFPLLTIAQTNERELPFRKISKYPDSYTANKVAARLIESLGFRYYWATEGLTQKDLDYKITAESRSSMATLLHIYELSIVIRNSAEQKVNKPEDHFDLMYKDLRVGTLKNLKVAYDILASSESLQAFEITFGSRSFPFWNQINGPISDALWHCGQVVMLRRASGNPINPNVSQFSGKLRE